MHRYACLIWLLLLCVVSGCPVLQSQDTPVGYKYLKDQVTDSGYYLYVPSTYDGKKTYPLVITLHGTPPWDIAWSQIREWRKLAEDKGFIVAVPKLRSTQGILPVSQGRWLKNLERDEEAILAVRREVCSRYRVDKKRILLTGFSAGGFPMYFVGLRHPDKFSMLIARDCNSKPLIFEHVRVTKKTRRIPIVIFYGKDDMGPIKTQSLQAFQWLRRNGWNKHNCLWKKVRGGHLRRPETTYNYWMSFVGK